MNVTELARRLRIDTKELLEILPEYGFDIGKKAIKIDDRMAQQVMKQWRRIKSDLDRKRRLAQEERKRKERALREEKGIVIDIPELVTVKNFAELLSMPVTQVIAELMKNGVLANQNQNIDYDTAAILAEDLGFKPEKIEEEHHDEEKEEERSEILEVGLARAEHMQKRAPIIVVMGHVDHGKTSLLDTVRKANITATEAGGITQHIGAYQTVWKDPKTDKERKLTFIDTPGHEAFTVMRSRGAQVADIAILIVAADDGVKPQTEEAIQIIKAAGLPYVVAINKIDKEGADVQKTMTELSNKNVLPEEWGGDVPMVEISAKEQINIDKLLDVLLLVADVNEEEIKADPNTPAVGTIIESNVDKHMGPVATVLVQSGTLHKRDDLVVNGEIYGRVRALRDYTGEDIEEAGPSVPAQIIGFKVAPEVGDILDVGLAENAQKIDVKDKRTQQTGAVKQTILHTINTDDDEDGGKTTLNVLIKSDVLGSLEAIIGSLQKLTHEEVGVKIVGKGLGNITESDVDKAEATGATIIGFNVKPTTTAEESMRERGVNFLKADVIYDIIDWAKEELEQLLEAEQIILEIGSGKVLAVFHSEKKSMIVGIRVTDGKVEKDAKVRVRRDGEIIGKGKITKCQQGQSEVKSVPSGSECGVQYEGRVSLEKGDELEFYTQESKARKISFDSAQ